MAQVWLIVVRGSELGYFGNRADNNFGHGVFSRNENHHWIVYIVTSHKLNINFPFIVSLLVYHYHCNFFWKYVPSFMISLEQLHVVIIH